MARSFFLTIITCLLVTGTAVVADPRIPTAAQLLDEVGDRMALQQQLYGVVYLDLLAAMQVGVDALSVAAGTQELLDELCAEQPLRCGVAYQEQRLALMTVTGQFAELMDQAAITASNLAAAYTIGLDFFERLRDYFAAQEDL